MAKATKIQPPPADFTVTLKLTKAEVTGLKSLFHHIASGVCKENNLYHIYETLREIPELQGVPRLKNVTGYLNYVMDE